MRRLAFAVLAATLLAAPAFAADEAASPDKPAPAKAAKVKKEKPAGDQVCERVTESGTLIPRRVCRTKAQIEGEREAVERMNSDSQTYSGRGAGATER